MGNFIEIPLLNPMRFVPMSPVENVKYRSKHFDDYLYREQVREFEAFREYFQKWQLSDVIRFQFLANFGPLQIELRDCDGYPVSGAVWQMTTMTTTLFNPGFQVFEVSIPLLTIPEGVYQFILRTGSAPDEVLFKSEWFELREVWENTILFEYSNTSNDYDVIFKRIISGAINLFTTSLRVEGIITDFLPGGKAVVYENDEMKVVPLSNKYYRTWKLIISSEGVPAWVAEKIHRIFDCDTVTLDGKGFTRPDGAKLEPTRVSLYPMAAWAMDIREANTKSAQRFAGDPTQTSSFSVVYNINQRAFGALNQPLSNTVVRIEEVQ